MKYMVSWALSITITEMFLSIYHSSVGNYICSFNIKVCHAREVLEYAFSCHVSWHGFYEFDDWHII